jgi:hypothetical protein
MACCLQRVSAGQKCSRGRCLGQELTAGDVAVGDSVPNGSRLQNGKRGNVVSTATADTDVRRMCLSIIEPWQGCSDATSFA